MDNEDPGKEILNLVREIKDRALARKHNDTIQSTEARRWAIVFTDLEKIEAYIQTFLVEEIE